MTTAVVTVGSSLPTELMPQDLNAAKPAISEVADAALSRLGQMHQDFSQSAARLMGENTGGVPPTAGASDAQQLANSVQAMSESFRSSMQVQSQIVQFSMAASISQTLGNQLNSFLKGT